MDIKGQFQARVKAVCSSLLLLSVSALSVVVAAKDPPPQTAARAQIAAANLADAVVVDCQLPGRLIQLGGARTYLTPGVLTRLAAIDCRTRGGEYTVGDLASGTLSLTRWLPLAEKDNAEAQYYVARIYANGMDDVPVDYAKAASWYQRAAKNKYLPAMQELGYLYEQGLGVPRDSLAGLNLQRQASGLGDQLDYAWKLTANKDEADRQVAAMAARLDEANAAVQDLRQQLEKANDRLLQDGSQIHSQQAHLLDLRHQLELARQDSAEQSTAKIQQLQAQVSAAEQQLAQKEESIGSLTAQLTERQTQMRDEMARSQAANAKLNELLASGKSDTAALQVRVAQMERLLNESQQELGTLRADYLRESNALAARSEELQRMRQHGSEDLQSLAAARGGDVEQLKQQIDALKSRIGVLSAQASSGSAAAAVRSEHLQKSLDELRAQYAQQQQALQGERAELARVQSLSQEEKARLLEKMGSQLAAKAAELETSQKRIAVLQSEEAQLRESYSRERSVREQELTHARDDSVRDREALREVQARFDQQHGELEKVEMGLAMSQRQLVQERERFNQQVSGDNGAAQKHITELEADVHAKEKQISALRFDLAKSGTPSAPLEAVPTVAAAQGPISNPDEMLRMVRGLGVANYHALVIGNSQYAHLQPLPTSVNDAKDVADVLGTHYGFDVKLLTNVTSDQIMKAMNEYARTLGDSDRLLIYYAGHGDTKVFPPERAFWLGIDADPDLASTWLSAQTVADAISMIHARHILLVADSCFSNAITHVASTTVVRLDSERSTAIRWNKSARMVLTSGENEPVADVRGTDGMHSMFASMFIAALRQNDILMSGEMLAHELNSRMSVYPAKGGVQPAATYANLQDPQHKFGYFFFVPVSRGTQMAALTP